MQIVPLTGKTKLVQQVVVASCATCATAIETKYCAQKAQKSGTTSAKKTIIVHNKPKTMAQLAQSTIFSFGTRGTTIDNHLR